MNNNAKEWIQYGCAVGMLISGVVLTFYCFFVNNDVKDNVLLYVAQCLMFAGGVFGVTAYFKAKNKQLIDELKKFIGSKAKEEKA